MARSSTPHPDWRRRALAWVMLFVWATAAFAQHPSVTSESPAAAAFAEGMELLSRQTQASLEAAAGKLQEARRLYAAAGDKRSEATVLLPLGNANLQLGRQEAAAENYERALQLFTELERKAGQGMALHSLGEIYQSLGDLERALATYTRALKLQESLGNTFDQAGLHNSIGNIYAQLGEAEKALTHYEQAIGLTGQVAGDMHTLIISLTNIARLNVELGKFEKALEYYELVYSFYTGTGDKGGAARVIDSIAGMNHLRGDTKTALEQYELARGLLGEVGDRGGEAAILSNIGLVHKTAGETHKALEAFHQSLALSKAAEARFGEPTTLGNLMLAWRTLKNRRAAVFWGKQAINSYQDLRQAYQSLDKQAQKSYLKQIEPYYRALADILLEERRYTEAHQVLNAFKDQQFYDLNARHALARLALTPREAALSLGYEKTSRAVGEARRRLDEFGGQSGGEGPERRRLAAQWEAAAAEFAAMLKQAETEFGQRPSAADTPGEVPDTRELRAALRELSTQTGQKAVAVYTVAGADNFHALIVSADGVAAASHPITAAELDRKALQLWALLQSDDYDPLAAARELYAVIFKPIEAQLPAETRTILWSLDQSLRYIPMSALHDGERYLIERYNHVVFTRADRERLTRPVSARWTGTGFGSSQAHTVEVFGERVSFGALPGVAAELRSVFKQKGAGAGILEGEVHPDGAFTKARMLAALKQRRPLVHIASHFSFRPGDEGRSFLLLGDGGVMTLAEMRSRADLFAGVELLTLSACNTAAQQADANGREVDGFAELAQRLGAAAVMATLWPVADNSSPWLMREFYRARQQAGGPTKAEALGAAQRALLNGAAKIGPLPADPGEASPAPAAEDGAGRAVATRANIVRAAVKSAPPYKRDAKKPFAHPYYWAPFVLIGNWR